MADGKNVGIEDILSSIRRLVSEDLTPAPRPHIVSKLVVVEKLILTPEQRVAKPAPRLHLEPAQAVRRPATEAVASLTEAVGKQSLNWESETGDPGPDLESLGWASFTFARRPMHETWAPEPVAAAAGPVGSKPGVPEAVVAETALPETEMPKTGLADAFETAPDEFILAQANANPEVIPDSLQQEDNIFSEQVLRELVRDLIREQLQGDLGERITRNIRKLVKAEIARALTVRTLD
jgi:hypothetical protein